MTAKLLQRAFLLFISLTTYAQSDSLVFENLKFRFIGPEGNRAIAIAGVPGDPMINYIGAASGGIWKTNDGGINWDPIFDGQDVSSIGSLAITPTNPDIVWAGTGETFIIRPALAMGDGIYKSEDAGKTWKNMGLEKTGRIGRVIVHPTNPEIVYAASLGHTYGPQQERGVYKTINGGKTWKQMKPEQSYASAWITVYELMSSKQGQQALFKLLQTIKQSPCLNISSEDVMDRSYPGGLRLLQQKIYKRVKQFN